MGDILHAIGATTVAILASIVLFLSGAGAHIDPHAATAAVGESGTPACSITFVPSTLKYGQSITSSWQSTNATSLSYVITNSAGKQIFGPYSTTTSGLIQYPAFTDLPPDTYTRTDTVTGPGGTATCAATITVQQADQNTPACSLQYATPTLKYGQPLTASWQSTNATSLSYVITNSAGKQIFGPYSTTTSGLIQNPAFTDLQPGTYTRTNTVTGPGGTATCAATITVQKTDQTAPACSLQYAPTTLKYGQPLKVSWQSTNATSLSSVMTNSAGKQIFGPYSTTTSGLIQNPAFTDLQPDTYTRTDTVTGPGGTATCAATLTVTPTTTYTRTLNNFTISVDTETGALLRITHPNFGVILDSTKDKAGLFTLSYPIKEFIPLQFEPQFSTLTLIQEETSNGLPGFKLVWNSLKPNRDDLSLKSADIKVVVEITEAPGNPYGILFKAWVINNAGGPLYQMLFPDLSGIRQFTFTSSSRTWSPEVSLHTPQAVSYPFRVSSLQEDRTPFYASTLWTRISLRNTYGSPDATKQWAYFETCPGKQLHLTEAAGEGSNFSASELMLQLDQETGDALRLAFRRTTPIPVGVETVIPGVVLSASINSNSCN
ncbi:MAG: hypothetical protein JWM46_248 [Candidatus Kaiserbacteria bacterium]|nr:hypothetical protein [Candidatus Kaiserbacteria bacterium]